MPDPLPEKPEPPRTIIQPITWCGKPSPNDPRIMVCGACSTPAECAIGSRCKRARDEDYA